MADSSSGGAEAIASPGNESSGSNQTSSAFRSPTGNVTLNATNVGNNADESAEPENSSAVLPSSHASALPSPSGGQLPLSTTTPPTVGMMNTSITFPPPAPGQMKICQAFVTRNGEYVSMPVLYYNSPTGHAQYVYPFTRRTLGNVWYTPADRARCELHPVDNPTLDYLVDRADLPLQMVRRIIYGLELNGGGPNLQVDRLNTWRSDLRSPNAQFTSGVPCLNCGRVNPVRLADVEPLKNIRKGLNCGQLGKDCINEQQLWPELEVGSQGSGDHLSQQQQRLQAPPGLERFQPSLQQQNQYRQHHRFPPPPGLEQLPSSSQQGNQFQQHQFAQKEEQQQNWMGTYQNRNNWYNGDQQATMPPPMNVQNNQGWNQQAQGGMNQWQNTPSGNTPSMWRQVENWDQTQATPPPNWNNPWTPGTQAHNTLVQSVLTQLGLPAAGNQPSYNNSTWNVNNQITQNPTSGVQNSQWFDISNNNANGGNQYRVENEQTGGSRSFDRANGEQFRPGFDRPRKQVAEIELTDEVIYPGEPFHSDLDQTKLFIKQEKGVSSHLPDPRALVRGKPLKSFEEHPPSEAERREFVRMRYDKTLQWYVGVIAKKVANNTITLLKCNTKDDLTLYGSWENTITIFFNKEGIRNSCVRVYLAQETFAEEVSSWWGAHQNRRPRLSLSWSQLIELIKAELVPDIEDGTTDEK